MMEWQPIETAAKDGSVILLANYGGVWVGYFCAVYQSGFRPANPWHSIMLNHDHIAVQHNSHQPTHWMSLPEQPKEVTP